MRGSIARLAAYAVVAYLTVGAFFYFMQGKLLFPAPRDFANVTPAIGGLRFEDLRIPLNGSDHLHAWWIGSAAPSASVLLVFHGNGYVIEDMAGDEAPGLHEVGANLLLIDYRGYGSSTALTPHETTVDADAEAALNYLLRERHVPIGSVFVLGRSIGSGPATYLASRHTGLGGLILETPFSSIEDAADASRYFRIFPLGLLLRTHFDNLSKIGSVHSPVLIVAGTSDTLTPAWMAERILARANQPKRLYLVPNAAHNDLSSVGGRALTEVLRGFVQESMLGSGYITGYE